MTFVCKATLLVGLTLSLLAAAVVPASAKKFTPIDANDQAAAMRRGVNVLGYDPLWTDEAKARFQPRHFTAIRQAGFDTVRVVVYSFDHMGAGDKLDPAWLKKLDVMIKAAVDAGLTVIIDEHDYEICGIDAAICTRKLQAFWRQAAPHFKDQPNRVMFELLNEPHEALTADLWNKLLLRTLNIVRVSNPTRNVVIGPDHWNGMEELPALALPANDRHIIVTFHYYHPMTFTHQGAAWNKPTKDLSGVTWGSDADVALLNKEFDIVKAWSVDNHRPIFLGEFGAYDKAAMADRARWDGAVARAAEARVIPWTYWQFDPDFSVYDCSRDAWVEPILHALIPPAP